MANHTPSQSKRDIVTLADLAPRHDVRGGHGRQIFGTGAVDPIAEAAGRAESRAAGSKKAKDLSPKSNPKGGKIAGNANVTLVRAAKPVIKKDLSPKTSPKGGKKAL